MSPHEETKMRYLLGYLDGICDSAPVSEGSYGALQKAIYIVKELLGEKEE